MLGIAVGIHLALVPVLGILPAQRHHQLVRLNRLICFVQLPVYVGQAVEEDGAIVLLGIGVLAVRVCGLLYQSLQALHCFVVVTERVVDQGFIEANFQGIGGQGLRFLQGGQRLLVVALPPFDLRDPQVGLGILRVGHGDGLKVLERRGQLVVIEQRLGQTAFRVKIIGSISNALL